MVAFLVDAWIETGSVLALCSRMKVAFLVDAWIETIALSNYYRYL